MKFERLALPIGHDRKPFVPPQPNYGRLLDFTEEEKHERDTREHRLYTPYVPPKEKPNHTIPFCNPQIERLAQPKHPQEPRQLPQGQLKAPAQNGRRLTSSAFARSVSLKADLPQRVDPSSKNRSHSMGKSPSSSQTKSLSDQNTRSSYLKRHRRQVQDLNQLAASYKEDRSQHTYGGTTIISYTPSALAQARERCVSIDASKIEWKSLEPLRRTESMHPSRLQCEKSTVPRSVSACPPASRAMTEAIGSPKVQIVVSQAVPKKSLDTMPKPPMQVRTRRLVCDNDDPNLMPWEKEPPPVAPVVIYATARCT
ncbi:unnamed protein product [Phytomonas sp. EM1]|nr:unnamed protein product [Phytomonas sp. EM1]|eukprot:CCW59730.1 unnamed protein product [Phytomonas sp. isolate EM1]